MSFDVEKVTFFEDRASICRSESLTLKAGLHSFLIEGLSPFTVDKSLVFECSDENVNCIEIHSKRKFKISNNNLNELKDEQHKLSILESEIDFVRKSITSQSSFRKELLTKVSNDCSRGDASAQSWSKALENIRAQEDKLQKELSKLKQSIDKANDKIEQLQLELNEVKKEYETAITMSVEVSQLGTYTLKLHYISPGACWRPVYKAFIEDKKVIFKQAASIWQNTGEGWEDIDVELSTERQQKAQLPDLKGDCLKTHRKESEALVIREEYIEEFEVVKQSTYKVPGIQDQGAVYCVKIDQKLNIPSAERPLTVDQSSFESETTNELVSHSEFSSSVNEIVHFLNTSSQALLAAPVNVYKEGVLCGLSEVDYTAPGQKVRLDSGNLPDVVIKRYHTSKTESKVLSSWTTKTNTVSIFISNLSSKEYNFMLKERIPVSESDKAKIEIVEKESKPLQFPNENGIIEWKIKLNRHAQQCVTLEYELKTHS